MPAYSKAAKKRAKLGRPRKEGERTASGRLSRAQWEPVGPTPEVAARRAKTGADGHGLDTDDPLCWMLPHLDGTQVEAILRARSVEAAGMQAICAPGRFGSTFTGLVPAAPAPITELTTEERDRRAKAALEGLRDALAAFPRRDVADVDRLINRAGAPWWASIAPGDLDAPQSERHAGAKASRAVLRRVCDGLAVHFGLRAGPAP